MVLLLCLLILLDGLVGIVAWIVIRRVLVHMRDNPEAARLVSEHVIAPILIGKRAEEKDATTV